MAINDGIFASTIQFPKELSAFQPALERRAKVIFEERHFLSHVMKCHEAAIHRRWAKKTYKQKESVLQASYSGMPRRHRTDLQHFFWSYVRKKPPEPTYYKLFLCPTLNVEDLSQENVMSTFLKARMQHEPLSFVQADLTNVSPGHALGLFDHSWGSAQAPYVLVDHTQDYHNYARLITQECSVEIQASRHFYKTGIRLPLSVGLVVLEAQQRIMAFLTAFVRNVLHDIELNSLQQIPASFPSGHNIQPTPREAAALFEREAAYRPRTIEDLDYLTQLVADRAKQSTDELLSLRQAPEYYEEQMREAIVNYAGGDSGQTKAVLERIGNAMMLAETWLLLEQLTQSVKPHHGHFITTDRCHGPTPDPMIMDAHRLILELDTQCLQSNLHIAGHFMPGSSRDPSQRTLALFRQGMKSSSTLKAVYSCLDDTNMFFDIAHAAPQDAERIGLYMACMILEMSIHEEHCRFLFYDELQYLMQSQAGRLIRNSPLTPLLSDLLLCSAYGKCTAGYLGMVHYLAICEGPFEMHKEFHAQRIYNVGSCVLKFKQRAQRAVQEHGLPVRRQFHYPCDKKRNAEVVAQMQRAERNLVRLWARMDIHFWQVGVTEWFPRVREVIDSTEPPAKTPNWTDQSPRKENARSPELDLSLSDLHFDLQYRTQATVTPEKPFNKAGGKREDTRRSSQTPRPVVRTIEQGDEVVQAAPDPIPVSQRGLKVFRTIFFVPATGSMPGEISWADFLHAMTNAGFQAQKLHGSAWHFSPDPSKPARGIHFHEPHPSDKIAFGVARHYGRRLTRAYGWTGATFVLAKKNACDSAGADGVAARR